MTWLETEPSKTSGVDLSSLKNLDKDAIAEDPTKLGFNYAVDIFKHFEKFANYEPGAEFAPRYFSHNDDPLQVLNSMYSLLDFRKFNRKQPRSVDTPINAEPTILYKSNGIALISQTDFVDELPEFEIMWVQKVDETLIHPFGNSFDASS